MCISGRYTRPKASYTQVEIRSGCTILNLDSKLKEVPALSGLGVHCMATGDPSGYSKIHYIQSNLWMLDTGDGELDSQGRSYRTHTSSRMEIENDIEREKQ